MAEEEELPERGLTPLNPDETATPRDIERRLAELFNEAIKAEVIRRNRAKALREAARRLRSSRLKASASPACPVVSSSPRVTVAQRQDWIDRMTQEEVEDFKTAEALTEDAMAYVRFVTDQTSKIQTLAKLVAVAYNLPGSHTGGGW